jgi:ankyrin repeat protein
LKVLLSLKADVKRTSTSGSTALFSAAEMGHANTSKILVEAGAVVNARRRGGATPLYVACSNGWAHVVELLCVSGADVNLACVDGHTPLHAVLDWAANGRDAMVAAFGDTSQVPKNLSSLVVAVPTSPPRTNHRSPSLFQSPFPTSPTPLSPPSKYMTSPELSSRGREVDFSPRVSRRPRAMSLPVVHEDADEDEDEDDLGPDAVDKGPSLSDDSVDCDFETIPVMRVPSLALRIIELLLNHGANTGACLVGSGESPLHLACRHGLVGCVRLLAPHSDVRLAAGDDRTTPLHLAARFGHTEIIDILIKADLTSRAHLDVDAHASVSYVDTRDAGGEAPLHLAARFGEVGAIRRLIEAGAEVDARRLFDQATPLTIAALFNRISAAKLLVRLGASLRPTRVSDIGNNSASSSMQGERGGADVERSVQAAWASPIEQAIQWGHLELAEHLKAVEKAGYIAWLAAPRLKLVNLRLLAAMGRATLVETLPQVLTSKEPSQTRHGRLLKRASSRKGWTAVEVEKALGFVLALPSSRLHAPDDVFAIIAAFWWP